MSEEWSDIKFLMVWKHLLRKTESRSKSSLSLQCVPLWVAGGRARAK